jgi:geranylgeranyl diphosphate synthase type II
LENFDQLIKAYRIRIDEKLGEYLISQTLRSYYLDKKYPDSVFDPLNYIMMGGGKRIRPLILILSCSALGGSIENAFDAAIAIEILHNFTLVHDDIMDNAFTRRGKETIHKKWSVNVAILVGDELIGLSYRSLLNTRTNRIDELVNAFTDGVIEVCEGQALDNQFETNEDIGLNEYYIMIQKKTAELLRISAVIGSIIADAGKEQINIISEYSKNLGMAFQIQDDLLDVSANEIDFGKKIGGDILEKKKTFMYLKSLEIADGVLRKKLRDLYVSDNENKINEIIDIYSKLDVMKYAKEEINKYTRVANKTLLKLSDEKAISALKCFSDMLLNRGY